MLVSYYTNYTLHLVLHRFPKELIDCLFGLLGLSDCFGYTAVYQVYCTVGRRVSLLPCAHCNMLHTYLQAAAPASNKLRVRASRSWVGVAAFGVGSRCATWFVLSLPLVFGSILNLYCFYVFTAFYSRIIHSCVTSNVIPWYVAIWTKIYIPFR